MKKCPRRTTYKRTLPRDDFDQFPGVIGFNLRSEVASVGVRETGGGEDK